MLTFAHSGDLGDIIYALPSIRAMGGGELVLRNAQGVREPMSADKADQVAELLKDTPYIFGCTYDPENKVDVSVDFDGFRGLHTGFSNLGADQSRYVGVEADFWTPWLVVSEPRYHVDVIVSRSARYQNSYFRWREVLERYGHIAGFVGTQREHADFIREFGFIPHVPTPRLIDLARVIAGCALFIGNQSFPNALAEALKKPLIQETFLGGANCVFPRTHAQHVYNGHWIPLNFSNPKPPPHYVAQHGEDRWLETHWGELGLPERGVFAEVGACDGFLLSNTLWLELVNGWSGLLVEPEPRWDFDQRKRPRSVMRKVACGTSTKAISIGQDLKCPSLSGSLRQNVPRIEVSCQSLTDLLVSAGFSSLDVLSIDTEGTELDVWASLDLTRFRPKVVIMEWNTEGLAISDRRNEIADRMHSDGYKIQATLGGNLVFST